MASDEPHHQPPPQDPPPTPQNPIPTTTKNIPKSKVEAQPLAYQSDQARGIQGRRFTEDLAKAPVIEELDLNKADEEVQNLCNQLSLQSVVQAHLDTQEKEQDSQAKDEEELERVMKMLGIEPNDEVQVDYEEGEQDGITEEQRKSPFRLLMKVASSTGDPRPIPLQAVRATMSKAWPKDYWAIDQVKPAIFVAYFRDQNAVRNVLHNQPWSVDSDHLLLEWFHPANPRQDVDEYDFQYIYVPIRIYGVPERYRVPHLMRYVINQIGMPSELHNPPGVKMEMTEDYISSYAKLDVNKPIKDRIKYFVTPDQCLVLHIHYNKIRRICTFCGKLFHNEIFCPKRTEVILHLQGLKKNTSIVPRDRFGLWTTQISHIPPKARRQSRAIGGPYSGLQEFLIRDTSVQRTSGSSSRNNSQPKPQSVVKGIATNTRAADTHTANTFSSKMQEGQNSRSQEQQKIQKNQQKEQSQGNNQENQNGVSVWHRLNRPPKTPAQLQILEDSSLQCKGKRHAQGDPMETDNEVQGNERQIRFKSNPPPSPQYSVTHSSQGVKSDACNRFKNQHEHYEIENISTTVHNQGTKKWNGARKNRWDVSKKPAKQSRQKQNNQGTQQIDDLLASKIQQAQKRAAAIFPVVSQQAMSTPIEVYNKGDPNGYNQWLLNVAASTWGPQSDGGQHWGMHQLPQQNEIATEVNKLKAAAPASKAPRAP